MPSFNLSLTMLLVGVCGAGILHMADVFGVERGWLTAEQFIWGIIQKLGWWYWGIPVVLSAIGLLYAATLDRPTTGWGFFTRIAALGGFNLYLFSPGDTAFGPLGAVLVLNAFVMWLRQQSIACRAKRPKLDLRGAPWAVRLYAGLTTDIHLRS